MAIDFRLPPTIERVTPEGTAVPLDAIVEVHVSSDLDRSVLPGALSVIDPQGQTVPGVLLYENRILRFQPTLLLRSATAYTVLIHGAPSAGGSGVIRSIVGVPMGTNVSYTFQTVQTSIVGVPTTTSPADGSEMADTLLVWDVVTKAVSYHVQVYSDPGLQNVAWESRVVGTDVRPAPLPEGQYWWRVAATDNLGQTGAWSELVTFRYSVEAPPVPIMAAPEPVFLLQNKTLTTAPTALEIKWPYLVNVTAIEVIRENLDGTETAMTVTETWTDTVLKLTVQEGTP